MNLDHIKNEVAKLNLALNADLNPTRDCLVIFACAINCYLGECSIGCSSSCSSNCDKADCVNGCTKSCFTGECHSGCSAGCSSMMSQ